MKHRRAFDKRGVLAMRADLWGEFFDVAEPSTAYELVGDAAIVTIEGPLTHHAEWFWDSYDAISERVTQALASPAKTVVLRIDSPGGECSGCFETVAAMRAAAAAARKRIVAYADGMAASAAYALACAGDRLYVPPSGFVGSIGVISTLFDMTRLNEAMGLRFAVITSGKKKGLGNPNTPISEAAVTEEQTHVDTLAGLFFELVASARPIARDAVEALEAGMLIGADAVAGKLADRVCTFEEMLEELSSGNTGAPKSGTAAEETMDWKEAAKKAADDGDEDAKKALESLEGDDAPESKKEGAEEEPAPESKKEGAEEEPAPESKKEKKDASARRPARASSVDERLARLEEDRERERLMGSRPDLTRDAAMKKKLAGAPIETVRWMVENLPKVASAAAAPKSAISTSPTAHAGTATPAATRAQGEEERVMGVTRKSPHADVLDQKLGFSAAKNPVKHEKNTTSIRLMTPAEAREHRKQLAARKATAHGGK